MGLAKKTELGISIQSGKLIPGNISAVCGVTCAVCRMVASHSIYTVTVVSTLLAVALLCDLFLNVPR